MLDFLLIGGTKCGSTAVADYLRSSSEINFSNEKEPAILCERNASKSYLIKNYKKQFTEYGGLRGEGTTGYSDLRLVKTVLRNINLIKIKPKLILIVRNPIKRFESHFLQGLKRGDIKKANKETARDFYLGNLNIYSRGMFGHILSIYQNELGKDNTIVLRFDDIIKESSKDLKKLKKFLDISNPKTNRLPRSNKSIGSYKGNAISLFWRNHISEHYRSLGLPKLTFAANALNKLLGSELSGEDRIKVDDDIVDFMKLYYDYDNELFINLNGFSYWDLKK